MAIQSQDLLNAINALDDSLITEDCRRVIIDIEVGQPVKIRINPIDIVPTRPSDMVSGLATLIKEAIADARTSEDTPAISEPISR